MFHHLRHILFHCVTILSLLAVYASETVAEPSPEPQSATASKKKRTDKSPVKSSNKKTSGSQKNTKGTAYTKNGRKGGTAAKTSGKKGGNASKNSVKSGGPRTSAEAKKQHEETRREIRRTEEELRRNEADMKKSLGDLGRITADLEKTRGEVNSLKNEVGKLDSRISSLSTQIAENEERLATMRAEYLKAVKKMRTARGNTSALAFIFSSDSFNQALRRMRYLKQFSEWKDKQSAEINRKVASLNNQKKELSQIKGKKDETLRKEQLASRELEKQGREQNQIVADLKRNGDLLSAHLSKKQQEANALKSRISSLIAEEERKAAAERAEAERRAAQAAEAERKRAEEERRLAEQRERERQESERQVAQNTAPKEEPAPEKPKSDKSKSEKPKTPKADKPAKKTQEKDDKKKNYADARKRKPRGQKDGDVIQPGNTAAQPKTEAAKPKPASADNGFASMRGALPRPVDGAWRVTSRFGRQELPDLPGIEYDNPGINVEVPVGAAVKAVYAGKISGVYVVPGYQTVVIINHGCYYTAYGNLKSPAVKAGDTVKTGQRLGSAAENMDDPGHGELHFEVYRNREKLNPLDWLR